MNWLLNICFKIVYLLLLNVCVLIGDGVEFCVIVVVVFWGMCFIDVFCDIDGFVVFWEIIVCVVFWEVKDCVVFWGIEDCVVFWEEECVLFWVFVLFVVFRELFFRFKEN